MKCEGNAITSMAAVTEKTFQKMELLSALPQDVYWSVMPFLSGQDLVKTARTCRAHYSFLLGDQSLGWRLLFASVFPGHILLMEPNTSESKCDCKQKEVDWRNECQNMLSEEQAWRFVSDPVQWQKEFFQQFVNEDTATKAVGLFFKRNKARLPNEDVNRFLSAYPRRRLLYAFAASFDWRGLELEWAVRAWLAMFWLPGSSRGVDYVFHAFALAYHAQHPGRFSGESALYIILFALVMLSTDLHHPNVKTKMSLESWLSSTQFRDLGLSREELTRLYFSVKQCPIFWKLPATSKQGWVRVESSCLPTAIDPPSPPPAAEQKDQASNSSSSWLQKTSAYLQQTASQLDFVDLLGRERYQRVWCIAEHGQVSLYSCPPPHSKLLSKCAGSYEGQEVSRLLLHLDFRAPPLQGPQFSSAALDHALQQPALHPAATSSSSSAQQAPAPQAQAGEAAPASDASFTGAFSSLSGALTARWPAGSATAANSQTSATTANSQTIVDKSVATAANLQTSVDKSVDWRGHVAWVKSTLVSAAHMANETLSSLLEELDEPHQKAHTVDRNNQPTVDQKQPHTADQKNQSQTEDRTSDQNDHAHLAPLPVDCAVERLEPIKCDKQLTGELFPLQLAQGPHKAKIFVSSKQELDTWIQAYTEKYERSDHIDNYVYHLVATSCANKIITIVQSSLVA
eukprot:g47363.t1